MDYKSPKKKSEKEDRRRLVSQETPKRIAINGTPPRHQFKTEPTSNQCATRQLRVQALPRVQKRTTAAIEPFTVCVLRRITRISREVVYIHSLSTENYMKCSVNTSYNLWRKWHNYSFRLNTNFSSQQPLLKVADWVTWLRLVLAFVYWLTCVVHLNIW